MTAVAFVWLGGLQEGSEPVVRSGSGNLSWRVQGWSDVVNAWSRSPADWAIGLLVGIDLIFAGWTLTSVALLGKDLSRATPRRA